MRCPSPPSLGGSLRACQMSRAPTLVCVNCPNGDYYRPIMWIQDFMGCRKDGEGGAARATSKDRNPTGEYKAEERDDWQHSQIASRIRGTIVRWILRESLKHSGSVGIASETCAAQAYVLAASLRGRGSSPSASH